MVELQPSKLTTWVRFSSPAPIDYPFRSSDLSLITGQMAGIFFCTFLPCRSIWNAGYSVNRKNRCSSLSSFILISNPDHSYPGYFAPGSGLSKVQSWFMPFFIACSLLPLPIKIASHPADKSKPLHPISKSPDFQASSFSFSLPGQ